MRDRGLSSSDFDPAQFKRSEASGFGSIAARYAAAANARRAIDDALLETAGIGPHERVLDLAAGPGVLSRLLACRRGSGRGIVACDLAPAMLWIGTQWARREKVAAVAWVAADAERLCFPAASFDAVVCGLAFMLFPDATAALREAARVLRPGGTLTLSVWGDAAAAPLVACALATIKRILPPPKASRPSIFRFGDPEILRAQLLAGGFCHAEITPVTLHSRFRDAAAYWQSFLDLAGGAAAPISRLPAALQARLVQGVADELMPYCGGDGISMASTALVATARRA